MFQMSFWHIRCVFPLRRLDGLYFFLSFFLCSLLGFGFLVFVSFINTRSFCFGREVANIQDWIRALKHAHLCVIYIS